MCVKHENVPCNDESETGNKVRFPNSICVLSYHALHYPFARKQLLVHVSLFLVGEVSAITVFQSFSLAISHRLVSSFNINDFKNDNACKIRLHFYNQVPTEGSRG